MWEFLRTQISWIVFALMVVVAAGVGAIYRERVLEYLQDVRQEWSRVTTPSREEALSHTALVIVGVLIAGIFMFFVDLVLGPIMSLFYR